MDLIEAAEISQKFEAALDSPVTYKLIGVLASRMEKWEPFTPFFDLSKAKQEEICRNNVSDYWLQKRAALKAWREKFGRKATCRAFLDEHKRLNEQLISEVESTGPLGTFYCYLVKNYAVASHPSQSSGPFSCSAAYVQLPLFEAPIEEEKHGSQQEAESRKPVHLSQIFLTGNRKANRKVILLEGVAGCGKTTLAWHAFQEWAKAELFKEFALLIHVSLEDPDIQSATCLADIIPYDSKEMREAVANAIIAEREKEVCFLLDGWDELPPSAQHSRSFLHRLIAGKPGRMVLSHCSIIVTSRPGASGSLRPLLTSRIVVGRLDRFAIDTLLTECLSEESEELSKLIQERPRLANLCNLPINAMIVIHLFRGGVRRFPETRTELFKALLCYVLRRHIELRTEYDEMEVDEQFNFEELPQGVLEKFLSLCNLAFCGIVQYGKVLPKEELKRLGLSFPLDTFSLVEAHLSMSGYIRGFAFLHYSVQEFLAAWHMTKLDSEEQAKAVSDILSRDPLSPVLPFYAGLTGLSNPAARKVLLEVTKNPLDICNVLANKPQTKSADRRRLALALLNCVYESQDPAHCQEIHPPYLSPDPFSIQHNICMMSFKFLPLTLSDCLSVGHVMAYQSSCGMDLNDCAIGDAGVKAVLTQVQRSGEKSQAVIKKPVLRWLNLTGCTFSTHCMRTIRPTLETVHIVSVSFSYCWLPRQAAPYLKYLIEGLSRRSTFFEIDLSGTLNSTHVHYLVLLFAACPLRFFQLTSTNINGCMSLMAGAMKQNTTLEQLWLCACDLWEKDLVDLGQTVRTNIGLLVVADNLVGSSVAKFLRYQFFSKLARVDFGRRLNEEEKRVYIQLLKCRQQTGLLPLQLVVEHMVAPYQERGTQEHFRNVAQLDPKIHTRNTDN